MAVCRQSKQQCLPWLCVTLAVQHKCIISCAHQGMLCLPILVKCDVLTLGTLPAASTNAGFEFCISLLLSMPARCCLAAACSVCPDDGKLLSLLASRPLALSWELAGGAVPSSLPSTSLQGVDARSRARTAQVMLFFLIVPLIVLNRSALAHPEALSYAGIHGT